MNEQNEVNTPETTNNSEVVTVESLGIKVSITEDSEGNILDITPLSEK